MDLNTNPDGSESPPSFVPTQFGLDDLSDDESAVASKADPTKATKAAMQASAQQVAELEAALVRAKRQYEACVLQHKAACAQKLADKPVAPRERKPPCKVSNCPDNSRGHREEFYHKRIPPAVPPVPAVVPATAPVVVPAVPHVPAAVTPDGRQVCKHWAACTQTMKPDHLEKYYHSPEVLAQINEARAAAAANRKVCSFFLSSGGCRWGDGCRDKHVPRSPAPQ